MIAGDGKYTAFSFHDERGQSKFGAHAAIYSTRIERDSFLLSALNGTIVPPPFQYSQLLATLRECGSPELATWVYGTEPDNAFALIERVWSLGDSYQEPHQLRHIERTPAAEGGVSYLMMLPHSKRWLLLNEYNYDRFTIYLHGNREFIAEAASRLGAEPNWDWRPDDP